MRIDAGQTLLFIGDSITDCERARPLGEGDGLGQGYVSLVNALMSVFYPERAIRVLNTGIGGNRVTDLQVRWQADALRHAPDWLVVMIGINDVWRQMAAPSNPDQVGKDRFREVYDDLLTKTRPTLKGLVLMTPFYLEANPEEPMRRLMDGYSAIVRDLASKHDALFVDVQAAFNRHLACRSTQTLCQDRVHPNATGHLIIARAFLNEIGFDWAR
jgi:lysophospholipase L1-like esterase